MASIPRIVPALLVLVTGAGALQAQDLHMPISAVSAGASESGSVDIRLQSTLGQAAVGRAGSAVHVSSGGFWYPVRTAVGVIGANSPPSAPQITEPADGMEIVIGSINGDSPLDPETPFTVRWSGGLDPDDDAVTYTWQLAAGAVFSELLMEVDAGSESRIETTLGIIADVLGGAGAELGDALTLLHRVVASDGQLSTAGPAAQITLVRGRLVSVEDDLKDLPTSFALEQNYPNPFNPTTTIVYDLPSESRVRLAVYDMLGRRISTLVDKIQPPGRHEVSFAAGELTSGLYLYRLEAGDYLESRSMLLAK